MKTNLSRCSLRIIRMFAGALLIMNMTVAADATVIGIDPILRGYRPDFSQNFADNTFNIPGFGNSAWWGPPPTCMCGPTAAADAMFWLAGIDARYKPLIQLGSFDGTPGVIIEALALNIGDRDSPRWDPFGSPPSANPFPGTRTDAGYMEGQKQYFRNRSLPVSVGYENTSTWTFGGLFGDVVAALRSRTAIELSNTGHWFAISGARTDQFDDKNGNGIFDAGDVWIHDYNGDGLFDRYLWVDNPAPGEAMQDWVVYSQADGQFFLSGDARRLDSVVFLAIPEPSTLVLLVFGISVSLIAWQLFGRSSTSRLPRRSGSQSRHPC